MMRRLMAALVTLALAAAPAAAQQGQPMQHRGMQGPGMPGAMMGSTMMGMGMHGPGMILALKSSLGLSDAQVQQIQKIRDDTRTTVQKNMQAAMQARRAAMQALMSDNPDVGAYQKNLQQAANDFVAAQVAMAQSYVNARKALTADQLQKLDEGAAMIHELFSQRGMMGGRGWMGSGMMDGWMNGGGMGHGWMHGQRPDTTKW